jgi:hypothetical protein
MDSKVILADLRERYGAAKTVLYADELAELLGKTRNAIYALNERDGLPFPVIEVGGRPAVSIYAAASVLAGEQLPPTKTPKSDPTAVPAVPPPKRKRANLGSIMRAAALQRDFFAELFHEFECIELMDEIAGGEVLPTNAELGRDTGI